MKKAGAPLPDCREWSLDDIDRHCEGLKEKMLAAVTEAIASGLEEAHVRFAVQVVSGQKDPLTMYVELPGMCPAGDDYPPVRLKFSLKDAATALMKPLGHAPVDAHNLLRVRNAFARLTGMFDKKLKEISQDQNLSSTIAGAP
ncbi:MULTISPECIES: hypothetical protein [unclassified Bradyrhizobium]